VSLEFTVLESAPVPCIADFDGSGTIDVNDLLAYLGAFRNQDPAADVDGSGTIDVNDLLAFLGVFRNRCEPQGIIGTPPPEPDPEDPFFSAWTPEDLDVDAMIQAAGSAASVEEAADAVEAELLLQTMFE